MGRNDGMARMFSDQSISGRVQKSLLDNLDPFVVAPGHMVCDECDEFIPLDEFGFNYDHNCLDPRVIREAYSTLRCVVYFPGCETKHI